MTLGFLRLYRQMWSVTNGSLLGFSHSCVVTNLGVLFLMYFFAVSEVLQMCVVGMLCHLSLGAMLMDIHHGHLSPKELFFDGNVPMTTPIFLPFTDRPAWVVVLIICLLLTNADLLAKGGSLFLVIIVQEFVY